MSEEQDIKQKVLSDKEAARRAFLKRAGKCAVWTPPAVAIIMSGTSLPASAHSNYGGCCGNRDRHRDRDRGGRGRGGDRGPGRDRRRYRDRDD